MHTSLLWKFTNQDNDYDYDNDNNDNEGECEEMIHCGWTLEATLRDIPESTSMDVDASVSVPESSSRTIRSIEFAPVPHNVQKILAVASFNGSISIWEDFSSESNGKKEYDFSKGMVCVLVIMMLVRMRRRMRMLIARQHAGGNARPNWKATKKK